MSKQSPRFTNTGRARTFSDKAPYLKPQFWMNPANQFWEDEHHTERAKEYFRSKLQSMMANVHNRIKVQNSQEI